MTDPKSDPAPPPMSDADILDFLPPADGCAEDDIKRVEVLPGVMGTEFVEVHAWSEKLVTQAIADAIAARDEQWRQRLEIAGYLVHGGRAFVDKAFTSQVGAELSASERKDGASVSPLYRIKEQG